MGMTKMPQSSVHMATTGRFKVLTFIRLVERVTHNGRRREKIWLLVVPNTGEPSMQDEKLNHAVTLQGSQAIANKHNLTLTVMRIHTNVPAVGRGSPNLLSYRDTF